MKNTTIEMTVEIDAEKIAKAIGDMQIKEAEKFIEDLICALPETLAGKAAWRRTIRTVMQNTEPDEREDG
jgi:hypothetical protein